MQQTRVRYIWRDALILGAVSFGLISLAMGAQSPASAAQSHVSPAAASGTPFRFQPNRFSQRETLYYGLVWGIDSPKVRWAESGQLIRFSWHVVDPEKAKQLNDKKSEPSLIDPQAQVKLVIPSLEKVGQLRQSSTPQAGMSYWMAFSNKGRLVKRGDHVIIEIGQFRANGLIVE